MNNEAKSDKFSYAMAVIAKIIVWLLCAIGVVYGSLYASIAAVRFFIFGGQVSAWGFEYVFVLASPAVGIIAYSIIYVVFKKKTRDVFFSSVAGGVTGIIVAAVLMVLFYGLMMLSALPEKARVDKNKKDQASFFKSMMEGKHSREEIKKHFEAYPLTSNERYEITSNILNKWPMEIRPDVIETMFGVFRREPEIIGFIGARLETSEKIKLEIADYSEETAIRPMARSEKTPPAVLLKLAMHKSDEIAYLVSQNPSAPLSAIYIYKIRAPFSDSRPRNKEHDIPPGYHLSEEKSVWQQLSKDKRAYIRTWVARNEGAPSQVLARMVEDSSTEICHWIFLNDNTPKNIKTRIAERLSTNREELILQLSKSKSLEIRKAVAQSKDTPIRILEALGADWEEGVQLAVLKNPRIPTRIIEKMSNGERDSVLLAIANHPRTPKSVLEKLVKKHTSFEVGHAARTRLIKLGKKPIGGAYVW